MLALRLPDDIEKRLDRLSKRTGRTKSYYAREAIIEHIEELEDLYLAEQEYKKIQNGAATYPIEEVMSEYGMEG
jgi:RHH-type transcriptional regulator, rel operon repressor / antitoxin RelB